MSHVPSSASADKPTPPSDAVALEKASRTIPAPGGHDDVADDPDVTGDQSAFGGGWEPV